jgi:hypothetical protein
MHHIYRDGLYLGKRSYGAALDYPGRLVVALRLYYNGSSL